MRIMHLKKVDANLLVTLDALLVDASVTRASQRLGRSASAISHALAKLRELFDDELFVRAGAGIVADSDPEAEFQECLNKAGALVQAIDLSREGIE